MEGLSAKQLGVIGSFSRTFQAKLCKFATGGKTGAYQAALP